MTVSLTVEMVSAAGFVRGRDARWNRRTFELVVGICIGTCADCEDRDGDAEDVESAGYEAGDGGVEGSTYAETANKEWLSWKESRHGNGNGPSTIIDSM